MYTARVNSQNLYFEFMPSISTFDLYIIVYSANILHIPLYITCIQPAFGLSEIHVKLPTQKFTHFAPNSME